MSLSKQPSVKTVHKVIVEQIISALHESLMQDRHADKVIERHMKSNKKWGSRDRKFFAESVYEIVRWYKKYLFLYRPEVAQQDAVLKEKLSLSQIWLIWGSYYFDKHHEKPEWPELSQVEKNPQAKWAAAPRSVLQSLPCWLDELGEAEFGAETWNQILTEMNRPAEVYIRVNDLKSSREKLAEDLLKEDTETRAVPEVSSALCLTQRKNIFASALFKEGRFEVQDAASQMISPLLDLKPGLRVVDACAGAGGKSLHIATLMKNKGKVISLDVFEWKLDELKTRARRQRIDIIETKWIENSKVIKRLHESADRLLLDVPCSGLGVLKRNPDKKWKISKDEIKRLLELQAQILNDYCKILKPGGLMVYATCSILPEENDRQVKKFLALHPMFELKQEMSLMPHKTGFDGFYAAVIERKE